MPETPDQAAAAIALLPCWRGRVDPVPLPGGITNRNFLVDDGGERFVVRLGADIPVHGILRFNELAASRAAFAAGISPEVVFATGGALVLRFIEGVTLTPALVRDERILPMAVDLVRRCHERVGRHLRGPALMFWVFQILRGYALELHEHGSARRLLMPDLLARAERLEQVVGPIDVVFGHNDLLAANFIDDGKRLWLIDWDYAGFNSRLFDLGGLVSNNQLSASQAGFVLDRYFGTVDAALRRRLAAMICASLLREAVWSMVSEVHSTIAFDYAAYTDDYLTRFELAWDDFEAM